MRGYPCLFLSHVNIEDILIHNKEYAQVHFKYLKYGKMNYKFKISKCAYYYNYECMHFLSSFNRKQTPFGERKLLKLL